MPEKARFGRKSSKKGSVESQEKTRFCNVLCMFCMFSVLAMVLEATACAALAGGSVGALAHRYQCPALHALQIWCTPNQNHLALSSHCKIPHATPNDKAAPARRKSITQAVMTAGASLVIPSTKLTHHLKLTLLQLHCSHRIQRLAQTAVGSSLWIQARGRELHMPPQRPQASQVSSGSSS